MNPTRPISQLNRGFTLVEMMVVIALISALSTFTLMNAPNLLGESRLRSGANDIHNHLALARQAAINSNTPTVLVLRTTGTHAWKSIAVFAMKPESADWTQIGAWHQLPETILVDDSYVPAWPNTQAPSAGTSSVAAPTPAITQAGAALTHDVDYVSVGFLPDGSMMTDENVALKVVRNPGDSPATVDPNNWFILLAERAGGRVKVLQAGQ